MHWLSGTYQVSEELILHLRGRLQVKVFGIVMWILTVTACIGIFAVIFNARDIAAALVPVFILGIILCCMDSKLIPKDEISRQAYLRRTGQRFFSLNSIVGKALIQKVSVDRLQSMSIQMDREAMNLVDNFFVGFDVETYNKLLAMPGADKNEQCAAVRAELDRRVGELHSQLRTLDAARQEEAIERNRRYDEALRRRLAADAAVRQTANEVMQGELSYRAEQLLLTSDGAIYELKGL
ncbi:MAG: hypothetical protein WBP12_02935 [Candidatus Saccharimonas sp.]